MNFSRTGLMVVYHLMKSESSVTNLKDRIGVLDVEANLVLNNTSRFYQPCEGV